MQSGALSTTNTLFKGGQLHVPPSMKQEHGHAQLLVNHHEPRNQCLLHED